MTLKVTAYCEFLQMAFSYRFTVVDKISADNVELKVHYSLRLRMRII